jgi:AcrR family transcriptional regulator
MTQVSQAEATAVRVLEAARKEVVARGILGMRVARVAAEAGCSITSMYRYFGSRDGLLAEVLLQIYEESFEEQFAVVEERLLGAGPVTEDDVVESIPPPHGSYAPKQHAIRSQVLAVAGTNPILRAKLGESLRTRRMRLSPIIDEVEARLVGGAKLDREVLFVFVFNLNWQYNDLLGDWSVSNEQYRNLLKRTLFIR